MTKDTLVFSIALNGYQWRYRQHLKSHQRYAKRFGYHYQAVTRPFFSSLGIECCWLKLTLMYSALRSGYKYVVFIDADAYVQPHCPPIRSVLELGKCLYMAKGYSNRFNSGVMIVRNCGVIRQWIKKVVHNRATPVEGDNDVGWGENSHIIELSKRCEFIQELPVQWNNTYKPALNDFIRHHNSGPLRKNYWDNLLHKMIFSLADRLVKLTGMSREKKHLPPYDGLLYQETKRILRVYPSFYKRPPMTLKHNVSQSPNVFKL